MATFDEVKTAYQALTVRLEEAENRAQQAQEAAAIFAAQVRTPENLAAIKSSKTKGAAYRALNNLPIYEMNHEQFRTFLMRYEQWFELNSIKDMEESFKKISLLRCFKGSASELCRHVGLGSPNWDTRTHEELKELITKIFMP